MKTIKFHKGECGVEYLLNVLTEIEIDYADNSIFNTDYFEILFFKKVKGSVLLNQKELLLVENSILFISPYQKRKWNLDANHLEVTNLVFQEGFLNDFFADKLFTYRLLYFYQLHFPLLIPVGNELILKYCNLLTEIKSELLNKKPDGAHIIRSLVYYLLQSLNREYANLHGLSLTATNDHNQIPFLFKNLMELHIREKQRINDYAEMLTVSRITLNKAVKAQFNITSSQLLKQRLLFEIQTLIIHSTKSISQIAFELNFSEPNHMMRFFKSQTGLTISQFIND